MTERYSTIVADPPWKQMGGPLRTSGAGEGWRFRKGTGHSKPLPYRTMELDAIKAYPAGDLARPDAHLYLWTTNAYLEHAYDVARAWGFKPSTLLTWAKAPMGGGLGGIWGISTEFILYARRGHPEATGRVGRTWFQWKRPYDERGKPMHSAKPPELQDLIETICPGPYVELFARRTRPGWDAIGDQL